MIIKQIPGIPKIPEVSMQGIFIGTGMAMIGLKIRKVVSAPMLKNMDFIEFKRGFGSLKILNIK